MEVNIHDVIGRWTVIGPPIRRSVGNGRTKRTMRLCRCSCGTEKEVFEAHLKDKKTQSCGCFAKEKTTARNLKHGETKTRLYRIYAGMRNRCLNTNNKSYQNYGGRGITVCKEWLDSYEAFRNWALSHGYRDDLSIERIDNDGRYCPKNCRWATSKEQNRNRQNSRRIKAWGETKPLVAWLEDARCRVGVQALLRRLDEGMSPESALSTPPARNGRRNWGENKPSERCLLNLQGEPSIEVSSSTLNASLIKDRTILLSINNQNISVNYEEWDWLTSKLRENIDGRVP